MKYIVYYYGASIASIDDTTRLAPLGSGKRAVCKPAMPKRT